MLSRDRIEDQAENGSVSPAFRSYRTVFEGNFLTCENAKLLAAARAAPPHVSR